MTERKRWNPTPSILYGVALGVLAGGLMILATGLCDDWPDQAATVLEITIIDHAGLRGGIVTAPEVTINPAKAWMASRRRRRPEMMRNL
jgi:hypothetical protein